MDVAPVRVKVSAKTTLWSAFVVLVSAIMAGFLVLSCRELAAFLPVLARTSRSRLPGLRVAHSWGGDRRAAALSGGGACPPVLPRGRSAGAQMDLHRCRRPGTGTDRDKP